MKEFIVIEEYKDHLSVCGQFDDVDEAVKFKRGLEQRQSEDCFGNEFKYSVYSFEY